MIESIIEALQFDFMRNALMAGVFIGLGYFFRFNPVLGAIAFALISALGMGWVERKMHQRKDTVIGGIVFTLYVANILISDTFFEFSS